MTKYAYLDVQGILRIVGDEKTAKEYAKKNGKVVTTDIEEDQSVPVIFNNATKAKAKVWVFGVGKAYWEPREEYGGEIKLSSQPELLPLFVLYGKLM